MGLSASWRNLPSGPRKVITTSMKAVLTVAAFYLLLTHKIEADGQTITIWSAMQEHMATLQVQQFLPFLLLATGIKAIGILSSMLRWHLLLMGQGIRFNFGHIVGSFLIGRFLGTFLPSTVGLDSYKLYDAARFSKKVVEPAAATAIEKVMGLGGVFLTFLITLPLGYTVLPEQHRAMIVGITVPVAASVVALMFLLLLKPAAMEWVLSRVPFLKGGRADAFIKKVSGAAAAYRGKASLLMQVSVLSFVVHFTTAAMYFFTALAVGAMAAGFWEVSFASSIQIFATVISPFTIAGEGVREIVQALLLARHIGASESILSAALGFWAAEAMTMVGAFFWWSRRRDYAPKRAEVDGVVVQTEPGQGSEKPDQNAGEAAPHTVLASRTTG